MSERMKQVTMRLPVHVMQQIAEIAKVAGVSPTQVYNVLLAMYVVRHRDDAPRPSHEQER